MSNEMPERIYAFILEGKRMWLPDKIISDSVRYQRAKAEYPPLEGVRDIFVMVQREDISVGKAMQYFEAWMRGELFEAFKKDGRA